jgi:putative endonuclease
MRREHRYYAYMLTSGTRRALYTGVTNNLPLRICQHREGLGGFTTRYKVYRLVHFEIFADVRNAIAREKEIKGWTRAKKNRLVSENNPSWRDLAADFGLEIWPTPKPRHPEECSDEGPCVSHNGCHPERSAAQ